MTLPDTLLMLAGSAISLAISYVPGLSDQFNALASAEKRIVMLAAMILVTAGVFGLSCLGLADLVGLATTCDQVGALELARGLILAVVANQATFLISPKRAG